MSGEFRCEGNIKQQCTHTNWLCKQNSIQQKHKLESNILGNLRREPTHISDMDTKLWNAVAYKL
jgi:hypothetical protein